MALFGLINFTKEGPGISKNAPKKRTFVVFFETFFRNLWKFVPISFVYSLISLPQITSGLAIAGITNVARNTARDKHSFGLSDFFDTIKKNWRQALPAGIINIIVYALLTFDVYYFYKGEGTSSAIGLGICLTLMFVFTVMNYFIWTLMITFKFSLKQIYKNSFRFVFINLKSNLICFLAQALVLAVAVGLVLLLIKYAILVICIEFMILVTIHPTFKFLLIQYCVFPSIKKFIIDPYYEEHPDEDLEMRRNLGVYTPEPIVSEDGENEDGENIFND
ncbi:MAG: YesL family protein [Clostridia bacterium]|nr:YesL family protein [Clostridia bacterium]